MIPTDRPIVLDAELAYVINDKFPVTAGQTIMHSHIHLIPRRKNDVVNPRGGVRGVVPGMRSY